MVLELELIRGVFEIGIVIFGLSIIDILLEGCIVNVVDNFNSLSLLCNVVSNVEEVNGKIVMIDWGECFFKEKMINV